MGFWSGIGSVLGINKGATPDYKEALKYLDNLPEYALDPNYYLDPANYQLDGTEYDKIQTDPVLRNVQMRALSQLQNVADQGGLTVADKAALQDASENAATTNRGMQEAIMQRAQAMGKADSGLTLMQQLMAAQGASQSAAQEGRSVAQMAQQRALDAILGAGNAASQMRSNEYAEQSDRARAMDIINQFNLKNRQALDERQADAVQGVADKNVSGKRDVGFKKSGIASGSAQEQADAENKRADRMGQTIYGAAKGAAKIFGA